MSWNPSKEEIQDWIEAKEDEFSLQEMQGMRVNAKEWKRRYIYLDMHDLFFAKFPCLLDEWLKRQVVINSAAFLVEPIVWDKAKLDSLKVLDNKWTRDIDIWFTRVKEGYIIDFVVEYSDSLSEGERKFEEGPRKQMLEEFPLWIKMLFIERIMMHMDPDRMVD
jgi:hypothetical protein